MRNEYEWMTPTVQRSMILPRGPYRARLPHKRMSALASTAIMLAILVVLLAFVAIFHR